MSKSTVEGVKKIRILRVSFNNGIRNSEISSFRSALIEKFGRDNIVFHNHHTEDSFLYKYPLILYKCIRSQSSLICLDFGVDFVLISLNMLPKFS